MHQDFFSQKRIFQMDFQNVLKDWDFANWFWWKQSSLDNYMKWSQTYTKFQTWVISPLVFWGYRLEHQRDFADFKIFTSNGILKFNTFIHSLQYRSDSVGIYLNWYSYISKSKLKDTFHIPVWNIFVHQVERTLIFIVSC